MEKKITQRIIGVLVVAALVVVLIPLLFNGNTTTAQTTSVKAPAFPDQQTSAKDDQANASTVNITPGMANGINGTVLAENNTAPAAPPAPTSTLSPGTQVAITDASAPAPAAAPTPTAEPAAPAPVPTATTEAATPASSAAPVPVATTAKSTPAAPAPVEATTPAPMAVNNANNTLTATVQQTNQAESPNVVIAPTPAVVNKKEVSDAVSTKAPDTTEVKENKKPVSHVNNAHKSHKPTPHQDITQLKKAAWVIQMGSFKVKSNAVRLANQLRAQGFKAFTREVKSSLRVYVGPEFKQASAASLATKIQQEMNMHGIVVSYNPLEL